MSHPRNLAIRTGNRLNRSPRATPKRKTTPLKPEVFSIEFGDIAPASSISDMRRDFRRQGERIAAAVARLHLPRRERVFITWVTTRSGIRGFLPMSHVPAREASSLALMNALTAFSVQRRRIDSEFRIYLGTFCFDDGVTRQRAPVIQLRRIKGKVDKAMRDFGLNGVYVVELEYLLAPFGTKGTRVNVHVHTACWVDSGKFRPRKRAEAMMRTARFPNALGAPSVDFRCKPAQTPSQIAGLARYISKWQLCIKQLRRRHNGKPYLDEYVGKYSDAKTLRMVEMLSRISVYDAVGGVREGKAVRKAWKASLRRWERGQPGRAYSLSNRRVAKGWRRVARSYSQISRFTRIV